MRTYFEIRPLTKEYESADKVFSWKLEWLKDKVIKDIEQAITIPVEKNVVMNPYVLQLERIPDSVRDQFKKNRVDGRYEAKANSSLNKRFLEVVRKHGLKIYTIGEFSLQFGWNNISALCPIITHESRRFFLEMKDNITEDVLKTFRNHSALSGIPEYDYLILRVNMLKAEE